MDWILLKGESNLNVWMIENEDKASICKKLGSPTHRPNFQDPLREKNDVFKGGVVALNL